jgi:hypothetical protein
VTTDSRLGKAGDFGVGNCRAPRAARRGRDESAAEHDGELRSQRRNFLEPRGGSLRNGLVHFEIKILEAI